MGWNSEYLLPNRINKLGTIIFYVHGSTLLKSNGMLRKFERSVALKVSILQANIECLAGTAMMAYRQKKYEPTFQLVSYITKSGRKLLQRDESYIRLRMSKKVFIIFAYLLFLFINLQPIVTGLV